MNNGEPNNDFSSIGQRSIQLPHQERKDASRISCARISRKLLFWQPAKLPEHLNISEATRGALCPQPGILHLPGVARNFQNIFRQRVTHSSRIKPGWMKCARTSDIFERLTASEIDYLGQALETVNREQMDKAVNLIRRTKTHLCFWHGSFDFPGRPDGDPPATLWQRSISAAQLRARNA